MHLKIKAYTKMVEQFKIEEMMEESLNQMMRTHKGGLFRDKNQNKPYVIPQ